MAKKIEHYDRDAGRYIESERKYDVYRLTAIKEAYDRYESDQGVTLNLYVDEETGIVTTDVAAYERSLR